MADVNANVVISNPRPVFTDSRSFRAVSNGRVYIGIIDTDPTIPANQLPVYIENESGNLVQIPQPLIINASGKIVYGGQLVKVLTVQGHSMAVCDAYGSLVDYIPNVLKYDPDQFRQQITGLGGDKLIGSSFGGTVYSDYNLSPIKKKGLFGAASMVNSSTEAVYYPLEGLWYISKGASYPAVIPAIPDNTWRCVGLLNGYPVFDVRNWGLMGDDRTDNTVNWSRMLDKNSGYQVSLYFPAGTYRYTDIGNVKMSRCAFRGDGSMKTIFKCTRTSPGHVALKIDAWPDPNDPNQPFIDGFNMSGIHVEGNENTATVIDIQGLARSIWDDVSAWGAQPGVGSGIILRASSLNNFNNLMCSKYRNLSGQTVNAPLYGMQMTTGTRAGVGQGSPSNNLFTNLYMEGVARGLNIIYGDNNNFIGGSCEANSDYGTNLSAICRYNTFLGMGNENLNATSGDFIDKGIYTKFTQAKDSLLRVKIVL